VRVRLRAAATGATSDVRAAYVVAADGGRAPVRRALGIGSVSSGALYESVSAVVRAPLWDVVGAHRFLLYGVDAPAAPGTFLPAGEGDRWIFATERRPDHEHLADDTPERIAGLVRAGAGVPGLPVAVERIGAFSFVAELADRFREGRVLLAGDAAHRVTPRGGTGMNTAIASARDVAWKLAWVLRGWAGPALLDTYESERRPVVEHNVARSVDPAGSRRPAGDEVHVDLAGRLAHRWTGRDGERRSTLDMVDELGLTLLTGPDGEAWRAAAARLDVAVPLRVHALDPTTAVGLGVGRAGAVLVRPDAVPVWTTAGSTGADEHLRRSVLDLGIGGRPVEGGPPAHRRLTPAGCAPVRVRSRAPGRNGAAGPTAL
jgi:putative polyketide hydroxylase